MLREQWRESWGSTMYIYMLLLFTVNVEKPSVEKVDFLSIMMGPRYFNKGEICAWKPLISHNSFIL